jgi:hypothetical protein
MPRIEWGVQSVQSALLVSHDYHRIMPWRQDSGLPLWALVSLPPVAFPCWGRGGILGSVEAQFLRIG